jgi:hypothetical protein
LVRLTFSSVEDLTMAVKVMMAPAIASGELTTKPALQKPASRKRAEPRPKRRKSAVYDADGNEVLITLVCLKCQNIRPLSQFGLRKMADGSIRNQPWCRTCRSAPSSKADAATDRPSKVREEEADSGDSSISGESSQLEASAAPAASPVAKPPERRRAGAVAAEVAAALMAGR